MYSPDVVERALAAVAAGATLSEISREIGVARSTLRAWVAGGSNRSAARRRGTCMRCAGYRFPVPGMTDFAYAYLLGLYLGDGTISTGPRDVYRLRIFLDRAYPLIVDECVAATSLLAPGNRVSIIHSPDAHMDVVSAFSRHWPCMWQRAIVEAHPWRFLRGLIQSDGCRSTNTIRHPKRTYVYPRYQFSNRSDDIRWLFCEFCDRVGVRWRRMNRWTISVARHESVALMDRHIGPKR